MTTVGLDVGASVMREFVLTKTKAPELLGSGA